MATIYDIARETGLSAGTVSKVMNNYKGTSQKSREAVFAAIDKLDYVPATKPLLLKKSFLIGVLLHDDKNTVFFHFHYSDILEGFKQYVESKGYDIIFVNKQIGNTDATFYTHCKYRDIEGLLIIASDEEHEYQVEEIIKSDIPKISIEKIYDNVPTVISDNYSGAKKAMEYLYFLKHREIAYVDVQFCSSPIKDRLKAYVDYMEKNNLEKNKFIIEVEDFSYESGIKAGYYLLEQGIEKMPTAIFCICDEIARGLIDVLKKAYISVPEDISVIGFDDITIAKYINLTTIKQDRFQIGQEAGRQLLANIENKSCTEDFTQIDTKLVVRGTCRML